MSAADLDINESNTLGSTYLDLASFETIDTDLAKDKDILQSPARENAFEFGWEDIADIVGDLDTSKELIVELPSQLKSPPPSPTRPQARKKRVSCKMQIEDLRKVVETLTRELDTFQAMSSHKVQTANNPQYPWKCIAARQLFLLKQARSDNARLRRLIELQRQKGRSFKRLICRQLDEEVRDIAICLEANDSPSEL